MSLCTPTKDSPDKDSHQKTRLTSVQADNTHVIIADANQATTVHWLRFLNLVQGSCAQEALQHVCISCLAHIIQGNSCGSCSRCASHCLRTSCKKQVGVPASVHLIAADMTQETGLGIASMAAIGPNIWVGLTDGRVRVYKDSGQQDFQAHDAGVIAIVPCGSRAFTLAADGSLKGWNALSPSPLDAAAR